MVEFFREAVDHAEPSDPSWRVDRSGGRRAPRTLFPSTPLVRNQGHDAGDTDQDQRTADGKYESHTQIEGRPSNREREFRPRLFRRVLRGQSNPTRLVDTERIEFDALIPDLVTVISTRTNRPPGGERFRACLPVWSRPRGQRTASQVSNLRAEPLYSPNLRLEDGPKGPKGRD